MVSPWQGYGNMSVLTIRTNQNVIGLNHPPKKASSNIQTAPIVWSLLYVFQSPTQLCFLGRYLTASFIPVSGLQLEAVASVKPLGVLQMTCPGKKSRAVKLRKFDMQHAMANIRLSIDNIKLGRQQRMTLVKR
jgi:hypothetical protein